MKKTIYVLDHANYYNRIIKVGDINSPILHQIDNVNFKYNDGVTTSITIGQRGNNYDGSGNYVVTLNGNQIESRWFLMEAFKDRDGQWVCNLKRDVIADYFDEIKEAPIFLEKGWASLGDPAIFNNEAMTFNQIKTSERLLKDATDCMWIVGYVDKDYYGSITIDSLFDPRTPDYEFTSLEEYQYYSYTSNLFYGVAEEPRFRLNLQFDYSPWSGIIIWDKTGAMTSPHNPNLENGSIASGALIATAKPKRGGYNVNMNDSRGFYDKAYAKAATLNWNFDLTAYASSHTRSQVDALTQESGKIIKVGNEYFQVVVKSAGKANPIVPIQTNGSALALAMDSVRSTQPYIDLSDKQDPVYELEFLATAYQIELKPVAYNSATIEIPQNRTHTMDAPYDIFAIPVPGDFPTYLDTESYLAPKSKQLNSAYAFRLAQAIIEKTTSGTESSQLYDIQLVPYCPIQNMVWSPDLPLPGINYLRTPEGTSVSYLVERVTEEGNPIPVEYHPTAMFWATSSIFTVDLNYRLFAPTTDLEFKVTNECDMYRIVSPNYSGGFEFSITKNNGVAGFRADCAYKPYTPYIRVAPLFNNLYGPIQDDARGLICGGDFSLPQSNEAWVSYEVNNKTYLQSFDRQIENLEVNNSVQRTQEKWNVATGTIQAAVSGGTTGALVGGGYGAAIGALVGGGASLAGGLADMELNEQLRREQIDYMKDQFSYQLQNIRALPTSLTKIGAFNPNNKVFPILEYYTCTEIEKQALRDKIKYNGMTIGRIGSLNNLSDELKYYQGQLIRLEIDEDYHVVRAIADELQKGIYL